MKNLQDQFDIPLTEVVGRKIYITDFGREIAQAAEQILEQVNAINFKTLAYKGQLSGKLKISVVSTGKYVLPYFLSKFIADHHGIQLEMDVTNKNRVIESLEKNEIDFALVSILPTNLNIEKIDLLSNKLFLIGNNYPSGNSKTQNPSIIGDLPLIFRENGSGTRQTMERFILQNHIQVQKKMELTSNEAVKQAILAGLGYSIMPLIGIKNELSNGELKIIPVKGLPIKTTWSLIWLKGKRRTAVSDAFLKYIEADHSQIIKDKFNWYENY